MASRTCSTLPNPTRLTVISLWARRNRRAALHHSFILPGFYKLKKLRIFGDNPSSQRIHYHASHVVGLDRVEGLLSSGKVVRRIPEEDTLKYTLHKEVLDLVADKMTGDTDMIDKPLFL